MKANTTTGVRMFGFKSSQENNAKERETRRKAREGLIQFGIKFIDDATIGIMKNDLILIGAPSGVGKTQICCNFASSGVSQGKKVAYIALEAEEFEIEQRIKYPIFAGFYFSDPERPKDTGRISFDRWSMGDFDQSLCKYEDLADDFFGRAYPNLFTYYKADKFDVNDFIKKILECADTADLIIVDHIHYFDFDDDNENRAIKEVAKTARTLALDQGKPIILVAHLRKRDKRNEDLVADLDEFHGSSDLHKISTKVITISPGKRNEDGTFNTYFRIPKNRKNGDTKNYCAKVLFNPKKGGYEKEYYLGWADQKRGKEFELIERNLYPEWAEYFSGEGSSNNFHNQRQQELPQVKNWARDIPTSQKNSDWE